MGYKSRVWLCALMVSIACAHIPSEGAASAAQAKDPPPPVYTAPTPAAAPANAKPVPQPAAVAPAPPPAATATRGAADLDALTGPIALYPDALVMQILTAAQNYDTLKLFAGWLEKNAALKGEQLQEAAKQAGFSDALVALAPFPQVVKMMVENPDWTKALGQAVTADKKAVADSIQRLRGQAMTAGNLKTTPQQIVTVTNTVVEKTVEQQVVVVTNMIVQIQPANPQVVYVPQYNPQVVYVDDDDDEVAGAALVGFAGAAAAAAGAEVGAEADEGNQPNGI